MVPEFDATPPAQNFVPVCAIGASAGGVAALQNLFRHLPADLGLAYVVILHLNPDEPSALSDILSVCTSMPVYQVEDGPALKPNCVYVIPPNRELVIDGDNVTARPFTEPRGQRAPIDMFFRSVAAGRGDGMAIVLSGAGSDGALGVSAMKESGGIIMVQEPAEASFPSMPQSAIATGMADFIGPIARLAEHVEEVARSKEAVRSLDMDGSANDLRRIIGLLRTRTGHDFAGYKRATVMRRVLRRTQVCGTATLADYAVLLLSKPEEARALFTDLLISVTMFFRDEGAFEALAHQAIRPMVETAIAEGNESLRIWSVGCATGEEAYSVAILVHEEIARQKASIPFQIFATDLDDGALATAREGRYPRAIEANVSEERLARYFVDDGTHFCVSKQLRENVLFAKHSILKEPPFVRLDLIICRNLLIYLERSVQAQIYSIFHYGLRPGRYLFLGSAETVDAAPELFTPLDRQARIYSSRPHGRHRLPILPQFAAAEQIVTSARSPSLGTDRAALPAALHVESLESNAPASALVDDNQNILHLSPTAGRFILHPAGPVSKALPEVVRPELRLDLRLALTRALDHRKPSVTLPAVVAFGGERRRVAMQVTPVISEAQKSSQALVFFLDGGELLDGEEGEALPEARADDVRRLYAELKASQEALVVIRSDHDASLQELRAANEELQSMNEEYRSTSEELETSKEELQSINEELHTVNAELKSKFELISAAHSDLQNLTAATDIGTLFLDTELRIKFFTPPVTQLFNVTRQDIGRVITNFTHQLDYDGVEEDARKVLQDLAPIEREVGSRQGQRYSMRLRPYRTVENRISGTVVTFVDVSERARAEAALRESEAARRIALEGGRMGAWRWDCRARMVAADAAFLELWGIPPSDSPLPISAFTDRMGPDGVAAIEAVMAYDRAPGEEFDGEIEVSSGPAAGRWVRWRGRAEDERPWIIHGVSFDVTEARLAAQRLRESEAELAHELANTKALQEVSSLLIEGENNEPLYGRILDAAMAIMRSDCATLQIFEPETEELRLLGHRNLHPVSAQAWERVSAEHGTVCGRALRDGRRVFTLDASRDEPEASEYFRLSGIVSVQSTPLLSRRGRLIGMISTHWRTAFHPDEQDYRSFDVLVRQVADAFERVQADTELRESEARLQLALDATAMGSFAWFPEEDRAEPDARTLALFGITEPGEMTYRRVQDLMHPADREGHAALVAQALDPAGDGTLRSEVRIALPDGAWRWLAMAGQVLFNAEGRATSMTGTVRDITAEKEAATALRASEARFQALFAASPVPFIVLSPHPPDFTITAANDAFLGIAMTTREHLVGMRMFDAFTDDPARPEAEGPKLLRASLHKVLATRRTDFMPRLRYDPQAPDGSFQPNWWLPVNAPILDATGEVIAIIHQATKVTEQHLAEEAERARQAHREFLLKLSDALRSLADPRAMHDAALTMLAEHLGLVRAAYYDVDDDQDRMMLAASVETGAVAWPRELRMSEYAPDISTAYRAGTIYAVADSETDPRLSEEGRAAIRGFGIRRLAGVPLTRDGRLLAVLGVHAREPRAWGDDELRLLAEAADRTQASVDRARAEAALRDSEVRQHFRAELGDALRGLTTPAEIRAAVAERLGTHLGVDQANYYLVEGERFVVTEEWRTAASLGLIGSHGLADFGESALRLMHADGVLRLDDTRGTDGEAAFAAAGMAAVLSAPLRRDGRWAGGLHVHSATPRVWTDEEAALVRETGERAWAAIERARAEAALRESEQKLRSLFDAIDEGLAIVEMIYDDRGEIIDMIFRQVNAAYERQGGLRDVVGRSVTEVLPGVEEVWLDRYWQVARTGEPIRVEDYQGDVGRWFDVYFTRVDKEGRFVAIVFNDISERKRVEAELRASAERHAFLLRFSDALRAEPDADAIANVALRLVAEELGADRCYAVTIHPAADRGDVTHQFALPGVPPVPAVIRLSDFPAAVAQFSERRLVISDAASDPGLTDVDRRSLAAMRFGAVLAVPLRRGNGDPIWAVVAAAAEPRTWTAAHIVLAEEAAERSWAAIERARAEAALRESEERFRSLVEGVPQLLWRSVTGGAWSWASTQWSAYTGQAMEAALGRGWLEAVHPDDHEATLRGWESAPAHGIFEVDHRIRRAADGAWRWHQTRAVRIGELGGEWLGTCTDVEDQMQARAVLERGQAHLQELVVERTGELEQTITKLQQEMADRAVAEDALRQAQKMEALGQLTGGIAHDFNNMLQGVTGGLAMARRRIGAGAADAALQYLDAANDAALRAAGLTRRLLAFARRQRLEPRTVYPNDLLAGLSEMIRRSVGPEVLIELQLGSDQRMVLCDPNELESAVVNLCVNARDAMPEGGRLILATRDVILSAHDVAGHDSARSGDYVEIRVEDTGAGIPPEVLPRVTEPFFTTKPTGQGTGLGLSQVYGFAHQSDGVLRIESVIGQGTAVRLLLPSHTVPLEPEEESSPAKPIAAAAPDCTVLLVDDEGSVRGPAAERLRDAGYTVLEAATGLDALRLLDAGARPDVLVTDVGLPGGMNGRQVAEATLERLPGLPVLFISGWTGSSLPPGVEMIGKPFDLDVLVRRVTDLARKEREK